MSTTVRLEIKRQKNTDSNEPVSKRLSRRLSERRFDLCKAVLADALAIEIHDVVGIVAEDAGGLILLKDYLVFIGEYLKRVLFVDVHDLSDADGEDDSSELVHFSYYAC